MASFASLLINTQASPSTDDPFIIGDGEDDTPNYIKDQNPLKGKSRATIVSDGIEDFGEAVYTDPVGVAKSIGTGLYESGKGFLQDPVGTAYEFGSSVISSAKDAATKSLSDYLPEGITENSATEEQMTEARQAQLGDYLNASSLIPAAGLAGVAGKSLANAIPELEFDSNVLGSNLGNIRFRQEKLETSELNDETVDTLSEELMSVEAFKQAGMGIMIPTKSIKGYKLFRIDRSTGELFPLYVEAKTPLPVGQWVDAVEGKLSNSGKVKSSIGDLAYRPGFHAAQLPWVNHIGSKHVISKDTYDTLKANGANNLIKEETLEGTKYFERLRDEDTVWAEVEMPNDVDWQSEANSRARIKKDGTPEAKTAHITDQLPMGGHYLYNTKLDNPNQWIIAGSLKINRVLSDAEVEDINMQAGVLGSDMPRSPYSEKKTVPATVSQQTDEMLDVDRRVDTRIPVKQAMERGPLAGEVSQDFDKVGSGTLVSDGDGMMQNPLANNEQNFKMIVQGYPGFKDLWSDDVAEVRANITNRMVDNIISLYDLSDKLGIAESSAQWYRGANRIALGLADRFGLDDTKTAGVLAALSPGKDWFQNVGMAERIIKHHSELGPNAPWTKEMTAVSTTVKGSSKKDVQTAWMKQKEFSNVVGRPWGEMETPMEKALWIRAYDEVNFGSAFREISPEGDILGYVLTKSGEPTTLAHQSFANIEKAVKMLEGDGTLESISPLLGNAHKVRNFFNNILNPDSPKDVTVDTHQIAAGLFRPLGQKSTEVGQGLSGQNSPTDSRKWSALGKDLSGTGSSYGLYFDATTEAAKLRGVLPREMQSVSWEQLRTLFPKTLKSNKEFVSSVEAVWNLVDEGHLTPQAGREQIIQVADKYGAGGNNLKPTWATYKGNRRDIGIATTGLMGAAGLATANEAEEGN